MIEIISRFLPIFLILTLGFFLKRKEILNSSIIGGLKKIIVNVALPSILFVSFLTMEIEKSAILLFIATFVFCLLLYGAGVIFQKTKICDYPLSPFFFTGFEFGMVGVALFTSIFGTAQLYNILLIGLGHEFFIWFFYAPLLEAKNHGRIDPFRIIKILGAELRGICVRRGSDKSQSIHGLHPWRKLQGILARRMKSLLQSPIIIAILSAMFLNLTGLYDSISSNLIIEGILSTLNMLSGLVTPLILLTVGANLQFSHISWKSAAHLISLRLVVVAGLGVLLYMFTGMFVMNISRIMTYAFITFFLLPPPFIIPVFLGPEYKKEGEFYNGLLVVYTVVTLVLFLFITVLVGI